MYSYLTLVTVVTQAIFKHMLVDESSLIVFILCRFYGNQSILYVGRLAIQRQFVLKKQFQKMQVELTFPHKHLQHGLQSV